MMSVRWVWIATSTATAVPIAIAAGCGGGGIEGGCNPPCPSTMICVEGECVVPGDGMDGTDGVTDDAGAVDVPPDVPPDDGPDVPVEVVDDGRDGPREIGDDGGPRDDGGAEDGRREDGGIEDGGVEDGGREDVGPDDGGPGRGAIGDPCVGPADCAGPTAVCLVDVDTGILGWLYFPAGYCSMPCGSGEACGPDGTCVDARVWGGPANCMRRCSGDTDCRAAEGYMCTNYGWFSVWFCAPPW